MYWHQKALLAVFALYVSTSATAGVILFATHTDTIAISGQLTLTNAVTYEGRILLTGSSPGNGRLFNEWTAAQEDKAVGLSGSSVAGYDYPVTTTELDSPPLSLGVWHNFAFEYDGSREAIYVDGQLTASRYATGIIGNGSGSPVLGSIFRGNILDPGAIVYMDTFRVSNVARYSDSSYTPVNGDFVSDANTLLLYNFNESPGSATTLDLSGNGHTGMMGSGAGAVTSPVFVEDPTPEPSTFVLMLTGLVLCYFRRHSRRIRLPVPKGQPLEK